jgi:hypothetical protein
MTTLIDEFVTDELLTLGFGRSGDRAAKPHGERDAVVPRSVRRNFHWLAVLPVGRRYSGRPTGCSD